jgi:hypothetical protein
MTIRKDLPPPIRGGAADRQSAEQRRAAILAPLGGIYAERGTTASQLPHTISVVQQLIAGDASDEEILNDIEAKFPELAPLIDEARPKDADLRRWLRRVLLPALLTIMLSVGPAVWMHQDLEQVHEDLTELQQDVQESSDALVEAAQQAREDHAQAHADEEAQLAALRDILKL